MRILGEKNNLEMKYASDGSGAKIENIARTLKNFQYTNGGNIKDYNINELISEIKQGYPVLVSGYSHRKRKTFLGIKFKYEYWNGHCWLCHGLLERRRAVVTHKNNLVNITFESIWYPLYNWGWDGMDDGYYLANAFNTNTGANYPDSTPSTNASTRNAGENPSAENEEGNFQYKIQMITGIRK